MVSYGFQATLKTRQNCKKCIPEGNRLLQTKNEFRTFQVNTRFALIANQACVSAENKNGQSVKINRKSRLVAQKGMISNKIAQDIGYILNYF